MDDKKDATSDKDQDIEIREMPDINSYDDIIKAARTGRLIVFIGAGVSKEIGLPLWKEFADYRLKDIYELGLVDYRTYCDLRNLEPKKLLTICEIIMKENEIYPQSAKEIFKIRDYEKYKEVYAKLYSMNAIYVTTNYDECLDNFALNTIQDEDIRVDIRVSDVDSRMAIIPKPIIREVIIKQCDLLESKLQNGNVIHIHGSINDENNMVVTSIDYMRHYGSLSKDGHPELSIFLDRILNSKYVVLFIGYGLEEFEILEYMISKVKNPQNTRKHYLLYDCFKEDKKLFNIMRKYYLGFGVELIPYDISRRGYGQLITIIDEWSRILNKLSNEQDYIQKMQFIDDVIADKSTSFDTNARAVIDMARKDESLEIYLFKKISDSRWLDLLIDNDFYKPEEVPYPINMGNGYSIPYWGQTDYLNKLLDDTDNLNKEVIEKVLNIIQAVSSYKNSEGNTIDNYLVWNQFTDVINKIPNEYITNEVLELTRVWTKSGFNIDFVVEKIGETFLGKFLNTENSDDFEKVQIVIDIVTGLDEAKKAVLIGDYYFKKLFNAKTVELIARKCSMEFIESYLNRVIEVLKVGMSRNIINYDNEAYLIKLEDDGHKFIISLLHTDDNPMTMILVDKSDDKCEVLQTEKITYCNDDDFTQYVIDWLAKIFDSSKLEKNLPVIVRNLYYGLYSEGAYNSLFAHLKNYDSDPIDLLLHFYKDIISEKYKIEDVEEAKIVFLNYLLHNKYFALKKLALYVIGRSPDKYLTVIWNNIDSEIMQLIFQESYFGDELRVVLENISQLDQEKLSKILKLIESGPYSKYSSVDSELHKKVWRLERLNALRHITYFDEYITKNFQDVNFNAKLGPTIGEINIMSPGGTPLKEDDLTKMTNEELAMFISTFKTKNRWEGPTVSGLGRVLRDFVKSNPEKYYSNLNPFINTGYYYVYQIFYGLLDAWKEKKLIDWDNILSFILRYVDRDEFWNDTFIINDDDWNANHNWAIGVFVDLICEGTRDDKWAMEYHLVQKSKNIILLTLEKAINLVEEDTNNDYIHYLLNSIRGRALKALLYISLYFKRNLPEENHKDAEWDRELQNMFIKYMDSDVLDAYILFGQYLPQFMFLDKQWSIGKVNGITYENRNWEGFMVGYIYSRPIYKEIYISMVTHYKHSIYHIFKKEQVIADVANHIALGYLNGFEEEINNELFDGLIEKWDYEMIRKIIWYFGTYSDKLNNFEKNEEKYFKENMGKIRRKIIDFWDKLYIKYRTINVEKLNNDDKRIISDSIKLIGILDEIDKGSLERIKFAIPYTEVNNNSHYFIKKLGEITSDEDSIEKKKIIGELLFDLVSYITPTYPEEEIVKLVKYLYAIKDEKLKEYADFICNTYAKHNIEFLRDICLENRDF